MTASYLFYDIETTGLNKAFDQVLQFAAIRTDTEFNKINRHTIKVKLRPDVIPFPQAIITNRIPMAELASGVCEFEAIRQVHQLMNEPGTISLGYNTLGFDDEFLRFSFYRNLLSPYTHQYHNGCRRMDLLPITIMYWLYKKKALNWPQVNGKLSLKLEHLGSANKLIDGQSHDALVDVGATVELARIFFKEKKMWHYLEGYFEKETDALRIGEITTSFQSAAGAHQMGLMVKSEYGPQQNYQVPVLSIGRSIPYPNQTLWLRLDLPSLRETTPETLDDTTWVIRKRYGEPGILLPPHNRYWKHLGKDRQTIVEEILDWLKSNPELFQQIIDYHRQYRYPFIPNLDPDAALYQIGFFSSSDEKLCRKFHKASLDEKSNLINRFTSDEARALATRVLCRNYQGVVPQKFAKKFLNYMSRVNPLKDDDILVDYRGEPRTTPSGALAEIHRLRQSEQLDSSQLQLLDELEDFIKTKFPKRSTAKQLTLDYE
ncbi:MAG: exodeoxyribonuclease I [Desulfobacterales bacterium]|nr:MAG: exodeoxyribonuclease I [Desulfobacterales bacterium]